MVRHARAGHVTGGRCFGYDNVEIVGRNGLRSHVERRINDAEATVVRRIFEMCAAGWGYTRIAKTLNAEGVPAPRPQQGRPVGWVHTSIYQVLHRPLYRGEIVWNQTKRRDRWGQKRRSDRPQGEWLRMEVPEIAIVSADLWKAAQDRLNANAFDLPPRASNDGGATSTPSISCQDSPAARCVAGAWASSKEPTVDTESGSTAASPSRNGPQPCAPTTW